MQSLFRAPQTDYKALDALRVGAHEGRRERGGGGSRRPAARGGGRGPGPGVREAVVEGGGGSG